MNTLSTNLPNTTAKADKLVATLAALFNQHSKVRVWVFSAAVRLSDQDKPIALKLLVELAIVIRTLALLAQNARCATGKTIVAYRNSRLVALAGARRVKSARRSACVSSRQREVITAQPVASEEVDGHMGWLFEAGHLLSGRTISRMNSMKTGHTSRHMQCSPHGACSNPERRRSTKRDPAPQGHALLRQQRNVQFALLRGCTL